MDREESPLLKKCNAANSRQTDRRTMSSHGKKLTVNVSGARYETYEETLNRYPNTLLGCKERRDKFYDAELDEFFFDRNRVCFESILAYYQNFGVLIQPPVIPQRIFVSDIKFFGLGEDALSQAGYEKSDNEQTNATEKSLPKNRVQRKIWNLFEHPETSNAAKVVAIVSVFVIVISIILFCVETLPQFQQHSSQGKRSALNASDAQKAKKFDEKQAFFMTEAVCISWFAFEYLIRFLCSPNKWKFFISVLNVIDLVSILPFFITTSVQDDSSESVSSLAILRCIRLVRVFRIFKLSRYSRGLQILGQTLKASLRELGLLLFFLCVGVILFSSAVYYAEFGNVEDNDFESIPHSFWWAIITMTTVGYGDMAPKTFGGKLVGCMCAVTGVLAIALPVPVIVSNFAFYYSKEQRKGDQSEPQQTTDYGIHGGRRGLAGMSCLGYVGVRNRKKRRKKKRRNTDLNSNTVGLEQNMDHELQRECGSHASGKKDQVTNKAKTEDRSKKSTSRNDKISARQTVVQNGVEPSTSNRETIV